MTRRNRLVRAAGAACVLLLLVSVLSAWPAPTVLSQDPTGQTGNRSARQMADIASLDLGADIDIPLVPATRHAKMDSALARVSELADASDGGIASLSAQSLLVSDGRIQVEVLVGSDDARRVTEAIEAWGGAVTGTAAKDTILQCWVAAGILKSLADRQDVFYVRVPERARPLGWPSSLDPLAGDGMTEGVQAMNADVWHDAGYTGQGIRVAVVDGGFGGYGDLLGTELPAAVEVRNYVDGESIADVGTGSIHGTACAEIIHDMAPGASLYLVKISTVTDLEEAITALIAADVDVISTSIGWLTVSPGDDTGVLADTVDRAHAAGITWVTAAGNYRERHWGGPFSDPDGNDVVNVDGDTEVLIFRYYLSAGISLEACMRWDDWTTVDQDYDLYLVRWDAVDEKWVIVDASENEQTGGAGQRPTEYVSGVTISSSDVYGLIITRYDASGPTRFDLYAPGMDLYAPTYPTSLCNLADAANAVTVGAVDWRLPTTLETYSSEGPTNGPGGSADGGLLKPDLCAFDKVTTASYGASGFAGTSASTPHVAGAAALVLDAYPEMLPEGVETFLDARAIDLGEPGADTCFGDGRVWLGDTPVSPTTEPTATATPTATSTASPTPTSTRQGTLAPPQPTPSATIPAPRLSFLPMIWR